MINILVVDDEPVIVNSLYQMLKDTSELQLNVFKAMSGSQALEISRSNRIDVMLTDICMPNIDGLELQRLVQAEWPLCRVIFLTGYDSFEYAQQAIRQNGAGYVMKVEGDAAILDALRRSIAAVEKERENQKLLKSMQSALPLLRREFVLELLQNRRFTAEELEDIMTMMDFPLDPTLPVLMMLTKVRGTAAHGENDADLGGLFGVISIMEEYLIRHVRLISVSQPQGMVVTLYQPPASPNDGAAAWQGVYRHVLETLEEIQESSVRLLQLTTGHAIASESCEWNSLAQKHSQLEAAARIYAFDDRGIITDEALMQDSEKGERKYSYNYENLLPSQHQLAQLRLFINNGDEAGMAALLQEFSARLLAEDVPIGVARDIYYSLALVFQRCMNDLGTEDIKWRADPEQLMNMQAHFSWSKVFEYFRDIGRSVIKGRSSKNTACNRLIVEQINEYISTHISEDLCLVSLADRYHFHPSYLSRLYKHVSGITLGQYIVDLKIDHAKLLLASPDMQVNDISKSLGFTTAAYFGKFFKANTGLSPSEYHRQVLRVE